MVSQWSMTLARNRYGRLGHGIGISVKPQTIVRATMYKTRRLVKNEDVPPSSCSFFNDFVLGLGVRTAVAMLDSNLKASTTSKEAR